MAGKRSPRSGPVLAVMSIRTHRTTARFPPGQWCLDAPDDAFGTNDGRRDPLTPLVSSRYRPEGAWRSVGRVSGSDLALPRLRHRLRVLVWGAGILRREGVAQRSPAVSTVPFGGPPDANGRRSAGVPRGVVFRVRRTSCRPLRATCGPSGLLQHVLRYGPRRGAEYTGDGLTYRGPDRRRTAWA